MEGTKKLLYIINETARMGSLRDFIYIYNHTYKI